MFYAAPAAPATTTVGNPAVNISIFGIFVLITLAITFKASRNNKSAADYYAAGRNISGTQNGLAIAGDYLSASPAPSPSTATTASCTPSASSSPGWSPSCSSPS